MLICVTNRKVCRGDFLERINQIAIGKPQAIMLREKDLGKLEFENLARNVNMICLKNQVKFIINQNIRVAAKMELSIIHLSLQDLKKNVNKIKQFSEIGASVHSVIEAKEAQESGATYLIAGHIFSTDCKKGVPPRGLSFLKEVCLSVELPVYAIGGISKDNVKDVTDAGALGICLMSEAMTCLKPVELASNFRF